jgi:hypothetical protein
MKWKAFSLQDVSGEIEGVDYGSSRLQSADGSELYIKWRLDDDLRNVEFCHATLDGSSIEESEVDDYIPLWKAEILRKHAID